MDLGRRPDQDQSSIDGLTGGGNHEITTLAPSGSAVTGQSYQFVRKL
jgi:hypothetical protein